MKNRWNRRRTRATNEKQNNEIRRRFQRDLPVPAVFREPARGVVFPDDASWIEKEETMAARNGDNLDQTLLKQADESRVLSSAWLFVNYPFGCPRGDFSSFYPDAGAINE